jgi:hypothetical protein
MFLYFAFQINSMFWVWPLQFGINYQGKSGGKDKNLAGAICEEKFRSKIMNCQ